MMPFARLSVALLSLVACYGCGSEDPIPGQADAFVGRWQGSGKGYRYSGENGEFNWDLQANAIITRAGPSAVTVTSAALSSFCPAVYDLGDNGVGALRPAWGSAIYCDGGSFALQDEVLSLSISGKQNHLTYYESWSLALTLTRAP
jgi:hypothetical protein